MEWVSKWYLSCQVAYWKPDRGMRCMYSKQIRAAGDAKVEVGLLSPLRKEDNDNDGLEVSNHPISREEVVHHMVVIRWKTVS